MFDNCDRDVLIHLEVRDVSLEQRYHRRERIMELVESHTVRDKRPPLPVVFVTRFSLQSRREHVPREESHHICDTTYEFVRTN
jgi:hypothetical protein